MKESENQPFDILNSNRIPISLALFTVEDPPKFVNQNTIGNKIFKG